MSISGCQAGVGVGDVVVSSTIPETNDTGSKLIPCPELTCPPPDPHLILNHTVKWSWLPWVRLRTHRSPGIAKDAQVPGSSGTHAALSSVPWSIRLQTVCGCFFNCVYSQALSPWGKLRHRGYLESKRRAEAEAKPQPGELQLCTSGCLQGWCRPPAAVRKAALY